MRQSLKFSLATKLFIVVVVMLSLSIRGWRSITPRSLQSSALRFKGTSKLQFVSSDSQKPVKKSNGNLQMAWGDRGGNDRGGGSRGGGGDFKRSGGGGRGGGGSRFGGGGRGGRAPYVDPFAKLNFRQTIKIDPESTTTIQAMNMSPLTQKVLIDKGFTVMTPVQSQSYKEVFDGNDVVARSRTGTGKTFAFGLPLIEKIVSQGANNLPSSKLPVILILEPTRELAMQVAQELSTVCRPHRLRISAIYGGVPFFKQSEQIANGVHIIVGTPGRILDHISRGTVDFSHVQHVVLDEGDTMLEMGFQEAVESILMSVKAPGADARRQASKFLATASAVDDGEEEEEEEEYDEDEDSTFEEDSDDDNWTPSRAKDSKIQPAAATVAPVDSLRSVQMLLFSATMPAWICKLTDKLMKSPIFLDAVQEGETRLASTITHYAMPLPLGSGRMSSRGSPRMTAVGAYLEDLILTRGGGGQTIIFTQTKEEADVLAMSNAFGSLKSAVLHGDVSQYQRQLTLKQFKEKGLDVLVATDVAARGLDIAGVDLVVHTSPPNDPDSYVHRSGRTGRAGRAGTSVLLHTREDERKMQLFESALTFKFQRIGPPSPQEIVKACAELSERRLETIPESIVSQFVPYARDLLARAEEGVWPAIEGDEEEIDDDIDEDEDSDDAEEVDKVSSKITKFSAKEGSIMSTNSKKAVVTPDLIIARALAAMSNRRAVAARSLLTGETDKTTLEIAITTKTSEPPKTIPEFQRVTSNVFRKRLEMEVEFGKLRLGVNDKRQTVFLADFETSQAEEIVRRMAAANMSGMSVTRCETLPRLIETEERSYSGGRGGGGGSYGRDGGARRDWSSNRSSGGGSSYSGDRRSSGSSYGGSRDSAGASAGGDRKTWQSRTSGR